MIWSHFPWLLMSQDKLDTIQLFLLIQGIKTKFEVTEELAPMYCLHETTTFKNIFKEVAKTLTVQLEVKSTSDGAKICVEQEKKAFLDKFTKLMKCKVFKTYGYSLCYSSAGNPAVNISIFHVLRN